MSRAEKGEATRRALIDAARKLFVAQGYFATGTEEIAHIEMLCTAVGLGTRHLEALPGTGAGLLVAAPAIVDALEAIVTE